MGMFWNRILNLNLFMKDQLGSLLATTPEALQRIANSEAVARNLRDIFPHPYTLDDALKSSAIKNGKVIDEHLYALVLR